MTYNSYDLGYQPEGTGVRVTLEGNAANVRLLDRSNYRSFAAGRAHHGIGAHYNTSPVLFQIPNGGHWFVVVDYGGYQGRGKSGVQVLAA